MKYIKPCLYGAAAILLSCQLKDVYYGAKADLHVLPRPRKGQRRIVCVGDSITHGYLVQGHPWNNYPHTLQKHLGDAWCVGNFGYSSRTANRTGDHPYADDRLFRRSLAFQPDVIFLMLGTNDSKPQNWNPQSYREGLRFLIHKYRRLSSQPHICLMTPLPAFPVNGQVVYDISAETIRTEIRPICRQLADEQNVELIDLYAHFDGHPELFADGVHPNRDGARRIAEILAEVLC